MPNHIDVHTLRSFVWLCNYYRIYVQDFNTIVHPLYALLKKDVAWTWSEKAQEVFNTLQESFQSSPFWENLILTRSSFYTLNGVLFVLVLFLANLMRKIRNMLSSMHPKSTTRLRAIILHTKGTSYISRLIFMAPISLCISTTSLSSGWWPIISLLVS
jgi:hypothetical protein